MRRTPATIAEIETAEEIPLSPIQAENEAIEQNIMAAFDADPENIVWDCKVYKLDRTAGNAEDYLFSVLPNELDGLLDRLRDTEGTGTYRVRVYRKEENKNRVFRQFDRRVKAPAKPTTPLAPQSDVAAILAAMERNNNKMIEVVTAALNRQPQYMQAPAIPANPFSMMTEMATAMGAMMTALRPAEGASSTDLILKGVELASKLEKGGGETSMLDVVRDALQSLPALVQMTEAQRALQPPAVTQTPIQPRLQPPALAPVATVPAPQGLTPEAQMQQQLRQELLKLLPKAHKNSEAGLYAELLADEWGLDTVTAIVSQPNVIASLQLLAPEIGAYLPWYQSLLAELTALVNDARADASGSADAFGKPSSSVNVARNTGRPGWGESDVENDE